MNVFSRILGKKSSRVWFIVTAAVLALFLVVNIVCLTVLSTVLDSVLGGKRALTASGVEAVYESDYSSKQEAFEKANEFNEKICEEGFVLLKNENSALPIYTTETEGSLKAQKKPKVSVFGKNSVNIALGGSGSGGGSGGDEAKSLYDSLSAAGYELNPELERFYKDNAKSGNKRPSKPDGANLDDGKTISIPTYETPQSSYTENVKSSYSVYNDAAIVVFTRMGGEGFDLPRTMSGDNESHYLELDVNEKALLKEVCSKDFKKIIVLLNIGTSMELGFLSDPEYGGKIDACLWIGFPGNTGIMALGRILNGNVNPSGRTTDTYAADFTKDPTWQNFGDNRTAGGNQYVLNGNAQNYYYVDYEEGVYSGYRYYETRDVYEKAFGQADWYEQNVIYPFGYGLSYSEFTWEIEDASEIENVDISSNETGTKYAIKVKVTNTSSVAGRDVVELYGHAPVDEWDLIEKPHKVLLDFVKTGVIPAGGSEIVTLTFDPYYLASYDATDANYNSDGKGGYELEGVIGQDELGAEYMLYVGKNAHESAFEIVFSVEETIFYEKDPVTGYSVENRYTNNENGLLDSAFGLTVMTRNGWENFPTAPTEEERVMTPALKSALDDLTHNNPEDFSSLTMPESGKSGDLKLRDLITGADGKYVKANASDPRWKELLDSCTVESLLRMLDYAAFNSGAIMDIGKPLTNDTDGPAGFINFMLKDGTYYKTCYYACQMVIASTWNKKVAEDFGKSVGNEGIWGADGQGNRMPYSGWYAPGMNIHRSPFGGRNFEYMSEDALLTGKMAAAQIKGCQSKGVYCFMKHFAVNEQETHRSINGLITKIDEQTLREVYLRPFEIAVKEGEASGVMSSFTRIGTRWAGGDYRLITEILRNEWGFNGSVITDFTSGSYMNAKQMYYAGGNMNLNNQSAFAWDDFDSSSVADVNIIRRAAQGVLYTVANSNAMNQEISGYGFSLWETLLIIIDIVVFVGLAVWGLFAVHGALKNATAKKGN